MVAQRRVPYWKFEGRLLFDPADFEAMLDAGYVAPDEGEGREGFDGSEERAGVSRSAHLSSPTAEVIADPARVARAP